MSYAVRPGSSTFRVHPLRQHADNDAGLMTFAVICNHQRSAKNFSAKFRKFSAHGGK